MNDQMQMEWRAWQGVVLEFRRLSLDINDPKFKPLVKAMKRWGEEVAELRMTQDDADEALTEAREAYPNLPMGAASAVTL